MRAIFIAPCILLAAFLVTTACFNKRAACAQETTDVVATIPWPDQETAQYVLLDRDSGKECGRGSLSVMRVGDLFELHVDFASNQGTDDTTVVVDPTTLKPISVRRARDLPSENVVVEGQYDTAAKVLHVTITQGNDKRTVPARLNKEHYYDNESSLFLWRTIPFAEGYIASYDSVLANQGGQVQTVTLKVAGKEQVTVPAGTFQTWRVEMHTSEGVRQLAWFTDTPQHVLVKYDNSLALLELTKPP